MPQLPPLVFALVGGLLPALAWLWFWLREDKRNPEPQQLIALAFLAGMITVAVVIPIENWAATFLIAGSYATFAAWAFIEEFCKYLAAQVTVLRRRENDEPIDAAIYLMAVALGFAAVENVLFLLNPAISAYLGIAVETSDLRAIGATLLHILSSATIGIVIAVSRFRGWKPRILWIALGVILATLLHTGFNFLILNTQDDYLLRTFGLVWIGIIILFAALEYLKRMRPLMRSRR